MNQNQENTALFSSFWPILIMSVSMAAFLCWQVIAAGRQYIALLRLADQQTALSGQAVQAETKLQAMMMDLITLSKNDTDAKAVVTKYGIKYNPAPQAGSSPVDTLLSQPKPKQKERAPASPDAPAGNSSSPQ